MNLGGYFVIAARRTKRIRFALSCDPEKDFEFPVGDRLRRQIVNFAELPADQLIRACVTSQSSGAWEEFMRRYHSVITAAAVRVSRQWGDGSPDEIDDVVQEIYLKFYADRARVLAGFRSPAQDAIFGFVKVVATNTARDFFRHKTAGKRGVQQTQALTEIAELIGKPGDAERQVTLGEINRLLLANTQGENGVRDRAIFQFYYRDGMTAQAISQLPGVGLNPKGVEGVLHRLIKAIRDSAVNSQEMGAS
jgi:RNA polymerase sigma factor (sigma-70 family)